MKKRFLAALVGSWLIASTGISVVANASDSQHQANRCAALFMILTSIQNVEPGIGQYFTKLGHLSGMMTSIYYEGNSGKVGTNGQMSDLKSNAMDKIGKGYPANYPKLESEIKSCIGWIVAVGKVMQQNQNLMNTNEGAKEVFRKAPKPTSDYEYPFEDFASMKPVIQRALGEWVSAGMVTPNSVKEALKN